jgi:hypothetical protein
MLAELLHGCGDGVRLSDYTDGADGAVVFTHACRMGLEGIVAKRHDRAYRSGRSPDWIKVKQRPASKFKHLRCQRVTSRAFGHKGLFRKVSKHRNGKETNMSASAWRERRASKKRLKWFNAMLDESNDLDAGKLDRRFPNEAVKQDYRAYLDAELHQWMRTELHANPDIFEQLPNGRWKVREPYAEQMRREKEEREERREKEEP